MNIPRCFELYNYYRVYDLAANSWTELSRPDGLDEDFWIEWAGPRTLALQTKGRLLFQNLDGPEAPSNAVEVW